MEKEIYLPHEFAESLSNLPQQERISQIKQFFIELMDYTEQSNDEDFFCKVHDYIDNLEVDEMIRLEKESYKPTIPKRVPIKNFDEFRKKHFTNFDDKNDQEWLDNFIKEHLPEERTDKEPTNDEICEEVLRTNNSWYGAREKLREKAYGGKPPNGFQS